jgi:hypothetical protein
MWYSASEARSRSASQETRRPSRSTKILSLWQGSREPDDSSLHSRTRVISSLRIFRLTLYVVLIFPTLGTAFAHLIVTDLVILMVLGKELPIIISLEYYENDKKMIKFAII